MTESKVGVMRRIGKGTLIYTAESPLSCLAVSPKAEVLAVAGRNLFQVFTIHEDKFVSLPRSKTPSSVYRTSSGAGFNDSSINNNKSHLYEQNASGTGIAATTVQPAIPAPRSHSVTDVAWSCADDILATGSTGGDITLWDVSHNMTQITCFSGHNRSIHCITFHPTNPAELISASHDGTLKLFDTRAPLTASAQRVFKCSTTSPSPFRDAAYSPKNPTLIAAAQENGMISIWDTRNNARPVLAFQGHTCSVATLDWHPNWQGSGQNWVATAGAGDHSIKVWNFDQLVPGQSGCPKLLCTVRTSNVSRIRWRPSFCMQLVSSCNQTFDLNVHLWDLRRPYQPYASFAEHERIVTSIAWSPCETNHFYTVGRDCLLIRHCVADGLRPAESASPVALSINVRGALAHAVSRDRVLANQPPPVVDETNLVTQSPYYLALKRSNSQFSTGNSSSLNMCEGPPGFYAAPTDLVGTDACTNLVNAEHQQNQQRQLFGNLPPMGSAHSAELFVSQAQSLLFYLEPSPESVCHPDAARLATALLPDLIIALAKNYEFIGPSVDRVCAHNAAVALRFGQSFLVQFWSMLRSIYGHLPTESEHRKLSGRSAGRSSDSGATVTAKLVEPKETGIGTTCKATDLPTTTAVNSGATICQPIQQDFANTRDSINQTGSPIRVKSSGVIETNAHPPASSNLRSSTGSGVYLREILETIGLGHTNSRTSGSVLQQSTSPTAISRRSSMETLRIKTEAIASVVGQSQQVTFDPVVAEHGAPTRVLNSTALWNSLPAPQNSASMPRCARAHGDVLLHEEPRSPPGTPAHPPHTVSHTIAIGRKRGDSLGDLSKPSPHSPQPLTNTLGVSHSSAQTADSLCEPVDFLLHYTLNQGGGGTHSSANAISEVPSTGTSETDGAEKPTHLTASKSSRRNSAPDADLLEALGAPDDPVILEIPYLPDEAFQTRHPIEQHLYETLATPRIDSLLDRRRATGQLGRGSGSEPTGPTTHRSAMPTRTRTVDRLLNLEPNSSDPHTTQHWVRKSHDGCQRTNFKPELSKDPVSIHRSPQTFKREPDIKDSHDIGTIPGPLSDQTHNPTVSQSEHETDSDKVQFLAPLNPSMDMLHYGHEPTLFNRMIASHLPDATPLVAQWFFDLVEYGHVQTVCTALLTLGPERLRLSKWISEARIESWFMSYLELLSRFRLWIVSARIIKQCGSSRGGVDQAWQPKELRRAMTLQGAIRPVVGRSHGDADTRKVPGSVDGRTETPARMRWKSGGGGSGCSAGTADCGTSAGVTTPGTTNGVGGVHSGAVALAPNVAMLNQASTTLSIRCGRCSKPLHATESTQRMTGHVGWACSRHSTTADPANVTCALCHLTVRGLFVWCRGCSHGGHLEHMQDWLSQCSECPAGCGHQCEYG